MIASGLSSQGGAVMKLAATPAITRRVSRVVLAMIAISIPVLLFAPWTQTVHGSGRAIAFNPVFRQQFLVSPIEGRVKKWRVVEGEKVKAGQLIAELVDNDPRILERLREQESLALERTVLAEGRVNDQRSRLRFVTDERAIVIDEAQARIDQSQAQLLQFMQELERAKADSLREEQNYNRFQKLFTSRVGEVVSKDQLEEAERKRDLARAQVTLVEARINFGKKAQTAAELQKQGVEKRTSASLQSEEAALKSVQSESALAQQLYNQVKTQVARQMSQFIEAPVDGTIFRLLANAEAGGQLVRPGERLAVLVPDLKNNSADLTNKGYPGIVAELWIDGNDLPLVRKGDRVLVQFEGWAAVQFASYPRAATGTFEGRVYLIDPTSDEKGRFRILVEPSGVDGSGQPAKPWPNEEYLRQGVRAQGWVLAQSVSVGYELWRLLNGFPPAREVSSKSEWSPLGPIKGK